jgi:hypothetical protein
MGTSWLSELDFKFSCGAGSRYGSHRKDLKGEGTQFEEVGSDDLEGDLEIGIVLVVEEVEVERKTGLDGYLQLSRRF